MSNWKVPEKGLVQRNQCITQGVTIFVTCIIIGVTNFVS